MIDRDRRKQLKIEYKESAPEAGVYRFVNTRTSKVLVGSARNLESVRNKLRFAMSTGGPSTLDRRLQPDAKEYGVEVFRLEILEKLDNSGRLSDADLDRELAALEALYREDQDQALLY